jgi:PadR family transcriptional regulator PadR
MPGQLNLMQGTLDMLILKAVSLGPLHGYGVLLRIQQISGDQLAIQQGSLYPALFRLEHQGLIASEWGESDNKRKAKFYRLTTSGRTRLRSEADNWNRMASLIAGKRWQPAAERNTAVAGARSRTNVRPNGFRL